MKSLSFMFCLIFGWTYAPALHAQTPSATTPSSSNENAKAYCPEIKDLLQDPKTKLWGVDNWVSGEESAFENKLVSFQGAQWVGAGIGKIICVYKSDRASSFYVTIQNTTLAYDPTGVNWGKYENGRKSCPPHISEDPVDVKDCPFYFRKKEASKDIYEQLDFFKKQETEAPTP